MFSSSFHSASTPHPPPPPPPVSPVALRGRSDVLGVCGRQTKYGRLLMTPLKNMCHMQLSVVTFEDQIWLCNILATIGQILSSSYRVFCVRPTLLLLY